MKIAVLGCGNMAAAIVKGIRRVDHSTQFYCYTPSQTKAIAMAAFSNGIHVKTIHDFPLDIDYWLIACKPQQVESLAQSINLKGKKIISILAGTKASKLKSLFDTQYICRVMPNLASEFGEGISLLFYNVKKESMPGIDKIFESCGMNIILENENDFGPLTVFTGSGPGFIYYLADIFTKALSGLSINNINPNDVIKKLFYGSSILAAQKNIPFDDLYGKVSSKGGVTESGISYLKSSSIEKDLLNSFKQAIRKEEELGK